MKEAKLICNKAFTIGEIDKRIYSSFVEHMGRSIYSGIYEPGHPMADEQGFRTDVLKLVKEMGVVGVRYPGGNFVSCYDWRDGVGPKEKRPARLELAWRAVETNEFGINEFIEWTKKAEVEPILAVNLGTKGMENAISLTEYCNHVGGTLYSDLRRKHGYEKPHGIKTWCLGNEMDGDWQIGHKTAEEYGRITKETAKVMKLVDPSIELVSCGSSKSSMSTFPDWELQTLDHVYDYVEYISLHQYYAGQEKGTPGFLAQSLDMECFIHTVRAACDLVKAKKHSNKTMMISFDEWGVWELSSDEVESQVDASPWQVAPSFSEQIYTMEDSLLFASMLMALLKNADVVKIACQSLLTNISACIMTERGGDAWVQPTYYPFAHMAKFGKGKVLQIILDCPAYSCEEFPEVPYLDAVAVYNDDSGEVVLFVVNRSETEAISLYCELQGFEMTYVQGHITMSCEDKKATNKQQHDLVKPSNCGNAYVVGNAVKTEIKPLSWNVIRVGVK